MDGVGVYTMHLFEPEEVFVITEQGVFGTGKTIWAILFDDMENAKKL